MSTVSMAKPEGITLPIRSAKKAPHLTFLSLPAEIRVLIYKHCLAQPEDKSWTLHLCTALSSTCHFIHHEFDPFLVNHYNVFPSVNRVYAFIRSLGYRSRLSELRRLAFVYFAENSEDSFHETFRSAVIIRHCFRLIARHCRDLLNLDVYIDEHWLRYYFPMTWGPEDDPGSDEYAVLEHVEGMAELSLVRGVRNPRFIWNPIRNPELWYCDQMESDGDDSAAEETGGSGLTKRGKEYLRQAERDMKKVELTDLEARALKDLNDYGMKHLSIMCQYELEKETIKEDLKIQKGEDWCVDSSPRDERVRSLLNERRRRWRHSVFGGNPPKARSYEIQELLVIGNLCTAQ